MMNDRFEIRLSGSGGQGIITAAIILAEAAGIHEKKCVCQTQSYGPEARGGTSKAEVVISDSPIDYPKAMRPNILLAMNQSSCDAYFKSLKSDGLLIVDSSFVEQIPTNRVVALPFTQIARKEIGNEMVANMIALGAVVSLSSVVSAANLEKAMKAKMSMKTEKINLKGLHAGIKAAGRIDMKSLPERVTPEDEEV